MIDRHTLNELLLEAFTQKTTWLEASTRYELDEFIETFRNTRQAMQKNLENLNDAHVAYSSAAHSIWSLSESVTHLIYSQGFYHNKLLGITASQLPHVIEAAKGFGEGAKHNVSADELREQLAKATEQINVAIEGTRNNYDLNKTESFPVFGVCNYRTWMLLLLAHEVDHTRQASLMRRLALTEIPK